MFCENFITTLTFLKLVGRNDLELQDEESTVHDKLPYKTGDQVCGAVVDRNSGKGLVTLTGKGFITQNIATGPDETGNRYQEIIVQPKQTCMIHGDAVVLYYKRRTVGPPPQAPPPQITRSKESDMSSSTGSTPPIEIIVRLQVDGSGKFSAPFDKSVLRPKVTTTEFFSWFSTQTRWDGPHGPPCLKFTFKDAMPSPKATEVSRGNEDHFNYMRRDIKAQCEKARAYMPDLREFVVLITVAGWVSPKGKRRKIGERPSTHTIDVGLRKLQVIKTQCSTDLVTLPRDAGCTKNEFLGVAVVSDGGSPKVISRSRNHQLTGLVMGCSMHWDLG